MSTPSKVILCPGQGAQAVGMGKAWYDASPEARAAFDEADRALAGRLPGGAKLSDLCLNGPADTLNRTDVSQPAIYTCSVAAWRGMCAKWGAGSAAEAGVVATAGLSLGEYTALHIAGVFSFLDGLELVTLRGRAMQDAAEAVPSGMVALIGATEEQAVAVCEQARANEVLVPANFNAPGQVVISGSKGACERSVGTATGMGFRATPLAVAGAFHSPIMAPASDRLKTALAATTMHEPAKGLSGPIVVVSNVTARPHAPADSPQSPEGFATIQDSIRRRLAEQLQAPVRWSDGCRWLVDTYPAPAEFHEPAPGKTLAGLMRRIEKSCKVNNHDEPSN
jgi:[acyl-carrier-protein] S-malonyltransferase